LRTRPLYVFVVCTSLAMASSCSKEKVALDGDGGNPTGDGSLSPDGNGTIDGGILPGCTPGLTQCSDCVDNDGDGRIDGFDVECTGAADNDESSFATAIPGDNRDATMQDCFFDGNSGAAQGECNLHVCCLLDLSQYG